MPRSALLTFTFRLDLVCEHAATKALLKARAQVDLIETCSTFCTAYECAPRLQLEATDLIKRNRLSI